MPVSWNNSKISALKPCISTPPTAPAGKIGVGVGVLVGVGVTVGVEVAVGLLVGVRLGGGSVMVAVGEVGEATGEGVEIGEQAELIVTIRNRYEEKINFDFTGGSRKKILGRSIVTRIVFIEFGKQYTSIDIAHWTDIAANLGAEKISQADPWYRRE